MDEGTGEAGLVGGARPLDPALNHFALLIKMPPFPRGDNASWKTRMLSQGFYVEETVLNGDCALDAMLAYLGVERRPSEVKKLRLGLAARIRSVAGDGVW